MAPRHGDWPADNALGGVQRQAGSRLAVTRHHISRLAISTQPPSISTQLGRLLHSSISTFPILPKCLAPAEYPAAYSSFLFMSFPADAQLHTLRNPDIKTISNALGW